MRPPDRLAAAAAAAAPAAAGVGSREQDDTKYAAAVAALPLMTPQRLSVLLHEREALKVWQELVESRPCVRDALNSMRSFTAGHGRREPGDPRPRTQNAAEVAAKWAHAARAVDVEQSWLTLREGGVTVLRWGQEGYPSRLLSDHQPPEVIFFRGELSVCEGPAAAIVGTRRATHYGTEVAAELGAGLAQAGVCVISGLAAGIDTAAHEGALAAVAPGSPGPAGIVGGGIDVYYPSRNRHLTDRVASAGALASEAPLGASPEPWRFPLRNRIIAALAQVVVVVESTRSGGAMHTVEAALVRGREVFAVPGSVRSLASEGTNELLSAGAHVARDTGDVLVAIDQQCVAEGVARPRTGKTAGVAPGSRDDAAPQLLERYVAIERLRGCSEVERQVYAALDEHPRPIDVVCQRSEASLGAAALALDQLMTIGLAEPTDGAWRRL